MKRLEELGVSPAPWRETCDVITRVVAADGNQIADETSMGAVDLSVMLANIYLIAAAPDLYECLRETVVESCHTCDGWHRDGDRCGQADGSCFVQRWRKALEKAGGGE